MVRKSMPNEITASYIEMIFLLVPLGSLPISPPGQGCRSGGGEKGGQFLKRKRCSDKEDQMIPLMEEILLTTLR